MKDSESAAPVEWTMESSDPQDLRDAGWFVAVHNDYILNGVRMTFWLFTHPGTSRFVRGEGASDLEALNRVRRAINVMKSQEPPTYAAQLELGRQVIRQLKDQLAAAQALPVQLVAGTSSTMPPYGEPVTTISVEEAKLLYRLHGSGAMKHLLEQHGALEPEGEGARDDG